MGHVEYPTPGLPGERTIGREMIWGGLAARCSDCGWTRVYEPGAVTHRLPEGELSEAISAEFSTHNCEDFPDSGNSV